MSIFSGLSVKLRRLPAAMAVAMLVASSSHAQSTPRFEPGPCPVTPEPIPALETAECGHLIVPENRANPTGRTIRLAVAIIAAESPTPAPDPVVFMTGGPGAAAILDTPFLVDAGINASRDLIVMAQRGSLYTEPDLSCPEIDAFYAEQVSLVFDAPSTGRKQALAAKACRDRFVAAGIDLGAYDTPENAQDFADLRQVLGIDEWNVYGYSYGSDLALSFLRDHPEGIRSVIVDSVVPPNIVNLPWTWSSFREGITTIFDACAAEAACNAAYPDLLGVFTQIVRRLEARPIVARVAAPEGGRVEVILDGGTLIDVLVSNGIRPMADIPKAIYELARGDARRWLAVRAAGSVVAEHPEQAQGMTQSFVCQEWTPFGSTTDILRAGKQAFPRFPESVLRNAPQLPFEHELCRAWKVPKGVASQRERVVSDIPTLVISGTFDSKTGAAWGAYAAETLSQSTYVKINGIGHWVVVQSECAQDIFQSFLDSPLSPDTTCAPNTKPAPFNVD